MDDQPSEPDKKRIRNSTAEFLIFTSQSGGESIEARFEDETIWLSQKLMAELFDVAVPTINEHLKNIFESGEIDPDSVIRKFRITAADGKKYDTKHYNLDAIISVGYRVNSIRATQFRQWATAVLRDFAIRGYVLDKERLKNGSYLGEDYFEHLLEEIREIRLSERRFYQKITDLYATAVDYNRDAPTTSTDSSTSATGKSLKTQVRFPPKSPRITPTANSRNTGSSKTASSSPTSINCLKSKRKRPNNDFWNGALSWWFDKYVLSRNHL